MPIRKFLDGQADGEAFDPETIARMSEALTGACRSLGLAERDDPATRLVAQKILELARGGEHDAQRLEAAALAALKR